MLIYCDSMILIYLLDAVGPLHSRAAARLATMHRDGDTPAVSDLTRLECRVRPLRVGAVQTLASMDGFFARGDVLRIPITSAVFDRATFIRARYRFRLGDSLHLAAAVGAGCDRFLTNDSRLAAFADIPVETLP